MNDVTVAPSGGGAPSAAPSAPAPAPAPAPSEVQINQNTPTRPNPVGAQAPVAPVGDHKGSEHRPQSRREAFQAAFDRANNPPPKGDRPAPKPAPKAAEAKPGHNQPPEATPKFDLKKRPVEPPAGEQPASQPRDRGRFAPREGVQNGVQGVQNGVQRVQNGTQNSANTQNAVNALPKHAPYAEPIQRMAESAKRDWASTPETVRGDIHRMHSEFTKASQYYKATHEAFKPIAHFHKMAQEGGTDLATALTHYVGMEQKLREDPIAALDTIIHNLGLQDPQTGQRIGLRDISYHVLSQSPEQLRQVQQGNVQQAAAQQIGALHAEVKGLKDTLNQMHNQQQYEKQFSQTRSAVDQFAATHPRLDDPAFGEVVKNEISLGFDLDTAYARAERLSPATHAAQTRTTPAQTRPTDRSISGSPDVAPSNGASRRPKEPSPNPRAALQNAMARLNGAAH